MLFAAKKGCVKKMCFHDTLACTSILIRLKTTSEEGQNRSAVCERFFQDKLFPWPVSSGKIWQCGFCEWIWHDHAAPTFCRSCLADRLLNDRAAERRQRAPRRRCRPAAAAIWTSGGASLSPITSGPSAERSRDQALLAAASRLRHPCHLCKPVTECYITELQEKVQWCTSILAVELSNAAQSPECSLWNSEHFGHRGSTGIYFTPEDKDLLFALRCIFPSVPAANSLLFWALRRFTVRVKKRNVT